MKHIINFNFLVAWAFIFNPFVSEGHSAEKMIDYQSQIKPIFQKHCVECHGPETQESDLRLDSGKLALAGGVIGTAIKPSKPDESLLLAAVTGSSDEVSRMPPEEDYEPLSKQQVALIRAWIKQGAQFPAEEKIAEADNNRDHWSFQPILKPDIPRVKEKAWPKNEIDQFVLHKLETRGISPSEEANKTTLIRRVSLDLIGLPPTLEEVQSFVNDQSGNAFEKVVDRLLASPHYGERWGRLWLDLARYADSDGYTNDQPKKMWKYRDWVIDALNQNMPFDQFSIEQLAGDMLPDATNEQLIATGFHRNTQINREGGSDREQYRTVAVNDRIATTGNVYLGLSLGCARCHNHKFDPISQQEYYELFAIFNNQDEPTYTLPLVDPIPEDYQVTTDKYHAASTHWKKIEADYRSADDETKKTLEDVRKSSKDKLDQLKRELDALKRKYFTTTYIMKERSTPRETRIFIRGEFPAKGKVVSASVPEMLHDFPEEISSITRLDFARWLFDEANPLTPRVTVNRIWQRYFGTGLVATENDFGTQGALPTHPKLLDYLAATFVESGYDLKALHKLIVMSATYRQTSKQRADLKQIDPENQLLARQIRLRLDAELIRDSVLHTAGILNPQLKGPSVFPPQPEGVMKLTRNPNRRWIAEEDSNRFRRTMYTYFWRSTPYPFLRTFDAPESNTSCTKRDRSNTPLQALTLLNEEGFVELAQLLAIRVLQDKANQPDKEKLAYAFQLCLKRNAREQELETLLNLLTMEQQDDSDQMISPDAFRSTKERANKIDPKQFQAWVTISRTLLNLDEFITRE